jgi:hypothetical protein
MSKRQTSEQAWNTALYKVARGYWWTGVGQLVPFVVGVLIMGHLLCTFHDEYFSQTNTRALQLAIQWQSICTDLEVVQRLAIRELCTEHDTWIRRPYVLTVLRISTVAHVYHWKHVWSMCFRWLTVWDPFYQFQIHQVVNAVFTSVSTTVPFLAILAVAYAFLLLRFPIAALRRSLSLDPQGSTVPVGTLTSPHCLTEQERISIIRSVERHVMMGRGLSSSIKDRYDSDEEDDTKPICGIIDYGNPHYGSRKQIEGWEDGQGEGSPLPSPIYSED